MSETERSAPQSRPGGPASAAGFETERLAAQLLGSGTAPLLQLVFESAGDYFLRVNGTRTPDADAAARELGACAATAGRDVAILTDRASGEPIGAIGWWRGNPAPEIALLGMLLVVPERRGQGLAREAVRGLESWLGRQQIRRLRTAVPATAFQEHKLLRALGFEQLPIRDHVTLGLAGSHLFLFEKPLE
jgi:GNAT superfamily N-acetyltransferase